MSNKINIQEIPTNIRLEGYLWWSDEEKPEVFLNEFLTSKKSDLWPTELANPFIIEGNLWQPDTQTSYLIRFIDGKYIVNKYELRNIDPKNITKICYLPHRMPEVEKLKFIEVWVEESDGNCLDFKVLKPAFTAFIGFKYKEEKK